MKRLNKAIVVASLLAWPALASERLISIQEVKEHAKPEDCWIVVADAVYDISPFIKKHEALCQEMKLTEVCGGDASSIWDKKQKGENAHKHKSVLAFERSKLGTLLKK